MDQNIEPLILTDVAEVPGATSLGSIRVFMSG